MLRPAAGYELQQFVEAICYVSSEYSPRASISYNAVNLVGRPFQIRSAGDYSDSYLLPFFGGFKQLAPSHTPEFGLGKILAEDKRPIDDFIVVSFETSVYPTGLDIYELLAHGAVCRIWAYVESEQWILLWDVLVDEYNVLRNWGDTKSYTFKPALRFMTQRTRVLCIEFSTCDLQYIAGIDAIMLKGLLNDRDLKDNSGETAKATTAKENIIRQRRVNAEFVDSSRPQQLFEWERYSPQHKPSITDMPYDAKAATTNEEVVLNRWINIDLIKPDLPYQPAQRERDPPQYDTSFTDMPYEVLFTIFSYLDIKSLRNVETLSTTFRDVVRDSRLYREINMRPYWMEMNSSMLKWLYNRCANIRKLDLSWCGMFGAFTEKQLKSFLMRHGSTLSHLRLNSLGLRNHSFFSLSLCPNVTELCLQNMCIADDVPSDSKLTNLITLDLTFASILFTSLKTILELNPSLQHLNLSCCAYERRPIAHIIGKNNRKLISLNLFKTRALSEGDLTPLANCTSLQELNLGYATDYEVGEGELSQLVAACSRLSKLVLAGFRNVHNDDILAIAQHCFGLQYLDLMGCIMVNGESVDAIFNYCTALRYLEINHCTGISIEWITRWQNRFPKTIIHHNEY